MTQTIALQGTAIEIGTDLFMQLLLPSLTKCATVMREQSAPHQVPVQLRNLMAGILTAAVGTASAEIGPEQVAEMLEKLLGTARKLSAEESAPKH